MTDHTVTHATFTLERVYPSTPARVFAAWADPAVKAGWFAAPGGEHHLDFRVGGREVNRGGGDDGPPLTYESRYHDITPDERIVYSSTLHAGPALATVSLTTVELSPDEDGTRLVLTEQAAYLDGHEDPSWREQGTGTWLDALGAALRH